MHIAMLVDRANAERPSGVERATSAVVAGLRERDVRVTLVTPTRGGTLADDPDVRAVKMDGRYQILRGYRPWIASAHRALRDISPDIVHGQGLLHHGIAAANWSAAPSVVTAHGDPLADARWHYPHAAQPLLVPLLRQTASRVVNRADAVIDVAPDWRANCPREPRYWIYVPNPIDPAFFDAEEPARSMRVLFFGGGRRIKGLDILLDAWPAVLRSSPGARLHVWGMSADDPSPLTARCHDTANCKLEGLVCGNGVAGAMRGGGVVAVPSRFEVAPLVVAEAWAVGLPVVATAVGGLTALATGAAALCPPEDPATLAAQIVQALEYGPETRSLAADGRERAASHRVTAVADAHVALYEHLLEGVGS